MDRAILRDPSFSRGLVVPVKREDCALPSRIKRPNPLNVDLQDDSKADQWDLLLQSCGADLGAPANRDCRTRRCRSNCKPERRDKALPHRTLFRNSSRVTPISLMICRKSGGAMSLLAWK